MTGVSQSKEVRKGRPNLRETWTTPHGYATISVCDVQYRKSGVNFLGSLVTSIPQTTSTHLPALDAGTEYDVRVRAVSAAEAGDWSEVQTERTFSENIISYDLLLLYIENNCMQL